MTIYYFTCLLSMFFTWLAMHVKVFVNNNRIKYEVFFSSLPLFLLSALRYGIGLDYFNYINIFHLAERGIFYKSEFLFNLTNVVISRIGLSEQWIFAVFSAFFLFFIYVAIFEKSPYPVLSVFLLVGTTHFMASLNLMRQMTGAAILLYGIKFIIKKDFKRYLLSVIAAWGFHFSCILFLPFYWLRDFKISIKKVIIITFCFAFVGLVIKSPIYFLMDIFNVSKYIGSRLDTGLVGYPYMISQLIISALALWKNKDEVTFRVFLIFQITNTLISFLSGTIPYVSRLRFLFGVPSIILIPLAVAQIENRALRYLVIFTVIIFFVLYSSITTITGRNGVLPYNSVLDY